MSYQPTWKERFEDRRHYVGPALAILIVIALAGWVAWHQWLRPEARPPTDGPALRAEAVALERDYERALKAGAPDAELEKLLNRAIQRRREAMQHNADAGDEAAAALARLESARGTLRGRAGLARSKLLEAESTRAEANGQHQEAKEKLVAALKLVREANANLAGSDLKDLARETQLASAIEEMEAEPLHSAVEVARTLALAAATREEWLEALKAYRDARTAQAELNQKFPGSRYANPAALGRFDAEIASVGAEGIAADLRSREREAETAAAAGRLEEAGKAFEAAIELQRQINTEFAHSRHASTVGIEALAARRDTVLSTPDLQRATELDREAALMLQGRQAAPAGEKIAEAAVLLERTLRAFPRSTAVDETLRRRLAYLAPKQSELAAIQEQVFSRLARSPLSAAAQMLDTEVTQDLYTRVMGANPSRNSGRTLPVDSVSWSEAREFCQRLSWVLGARVRLPTEPEFRAAFGRDTRSTAAELAAGAWSSENSAGHSHEVGATPHSPAGFSDLAGNVAEWLEPANAGGDVAPVAGGSYLDSDAALRRVSVIATNKSEHAPHIGFRFVVEWPK